MVQGNSQSVSPSVIILAAFVNVQLASIHINRLNASLVKVCQNGILISKNKIKPIRLPYDRFVTLTLLTRTIFTQPILSLFPLLLILPLLFPPSLLRAELILPPIVVRSAQRRMSGMLRAQVAEVVLDAGGGMAALFADVQLGATFVEGERERVAVDLPAVGLQGTALSEGLAARLAFVRANTCNKGKLSWL